MRLRALVWAAWVTSTSAIACDYPPAAPKIPDGKTATSEEMVTTQQAVKDYVSKMEAYIACLDQSVENLPEPLTKEQEHIHVEKHNAAVDEMQGVADHFNAEVRAYKDASDSGKH
jgi:ethanolamine utilization cobalamin adenosyltransferase